jgi:AAA family ATPase
LEERLKILENNFRDFPLKVRANLRLIAEMTEGFSGRDLVEKVIKSALHRAIAEERDYIETEDLVKAIEKIKRPVKQPPKQMFV